MSNFELKEVASGKFRVMNGADTIGSISVSQAEVPELLRHWNGPTNCLATNSKPQQSARNPVVNAIMKAKGRMSHAAILRAC